MAVFGVPRLHEDDALRAVRAAVEMRERLALLNDELERSWGVQLGTRTGVNTGEVVAGDHAGGQALVTGDAVNMAARLEQLADTGEILIGDATAGWPRRRGRRAGRAARGSGKDEPVVAWRLWTCRRRPARRRLDTPLVGRRDELAQLRHAYARAVRQRSCALFTVIGPRRHRQVPAGARVPALGADGHGAARPLPALRRGHHATGRWPRSGAASPAAARSDLRALIGDEHGRRAGCSRAGVG